MKENNFEKKVQKECWVKAILALFALLLTITIFIGSNKEERYFDVLKPRCIVESINDLEKCKKENHYIKVTTDTIYSTDYVYNVDNVTRALFIDIDLEEMSFIAVIEKSKAEVLLESDGPFTIEGHLEYKEDKEMENGKQEIVEDYKSQVEDDEAKEQIEAMILDGVLNEYQGHPGNEYMVMFIYLLFGGFFTFILIKNSYFGIYPTKRKDLKGLTEKERETLEKEFAKNKEKQKLFTTENYLFETKLFQNHAVKLDHIVWIYERSIRQYGIEVNRPLVLNMKQGTTLQIQCKQEQKEAIIKKIVDKTEGLLVGYTTENLKKWKEIKKQK